MSGAPFHFFLCSSQLPFVSCLCSPSTSMPYSVGLHAASVALLSAGVATQIATSIVVLLLIIIVASSYAEDDLEKEDTPATLPGSPFFAIIPFFRQRFDFLNWGFRVTGQNIFQFKLLSVRSSPSQSMVGADFTHPE